MYADAIRSSAALCVDGDDDDGENSLHFINNEKGSGKIKVRSREHTRRFLQSLIELIETSFLPILSVTEQFIIKDAIEVNY
jgi:hypothetical protein